MWDCASNFGVFEVPSSRPGKTWRVELHGSEGPARCWCPAYAYFKGEPWDRTCKHLEQLWDNEHGACLYNPQWRDGIRQPELKPVSYTTASGFGPEGECCPACGGPVIAVRRAV